MGIAIIKSFVLRPSRMGAKRAYNRAAFKEAGWDPQAATVQFTRHKSYAGFMA